MRGPRPRPGLKKRKIPRHAGNFILRERARRTSAGVSSAPKPSQYAVGAASPTPRLRTTDDAGPALIPSPPNVGAGFHARPAWDDG